MKASKYLSTQLGNPSRAFSILAAWLWNRRNQALNDAALEGLSLQPDDRVLEIGFGGGYLLERMATRVKEGRLAGADVSEAMVTRCTKRFAKRPETEKIDLRCAPVEVLPYPTGSFSKVCSVNSVFYWEDIDRAFCEIHRVLTQDGVCVLCFTKPESLQERRFAAYVRMVGVDDTCSRLQDSRFDIVEVRQDEDQHRKFACVVSRKG
jgi:ubiquinone/menaquinone biosynthesis C-methylase UbiE